MRQADLVDCHFYERYRVEEGFRYENISIAGPAGKGTIVTPHPPAIGDLIHLYDQMTKQGGVYRVVERAWMHSAWGSVNWPYGEPFSNTPAWLDIIVEETDGPFREEAPEHEPEKNAPDPCDHFHGPDLCAFKRCCMCGEPIERVKQDA